MGGTSAGNGVVWDLSERSPGRLYYLLALPRCSLGVDAVWTRVKMACAAARSPADQDR